MTSQPSKAGGDPVPAPNFHQHFRQQVGILQDDIASLASPDLPMSERKMNTDVTLARLTKLSADLADASGELPSYDQRSYNQALKELQDKLAITQASHAPKPKFSFKNKRLAAPSSEGNSATTSRSVTPNHLREPENGPTQGMPIPAIASPPTYLSFSREHSQTRSETRDVIDTSADDDNMKVLINEIRDTYVRFPRLEAHTTGEAAQHGQSCVVSDTISSIVNLTYDKNLPPLPFLTLKNVKSSLLLAPSIEGPAHMTGLRDSILVLSCHQFRMHDSHNVRVYLFCSSRPIIEDCSDIRFAQLPERSFQLENNKKAASERRTNMYTQVDDFKWLRTEPSPNWRLMKEDEQITESTWVEVLEDLQNMEEQSQKTDVGMRGVSVKHVQGVLLKVGALTRIPEQTELTQIDDG